MHRAPEQAGHFGDGQVVEIAQGQSRPVLGDELIEGPPGIDGVRVELDVGRLGKGPGEHLEAPFLAAHPSPVVDELVAGHRHRPRHRGLRRSRAAGGVDGGQEGLGTQILGHRRRPTAPGQVAIDMGKGVVVEAQESRHRVVVHSLVRVGGLFAHILIIVRAGTSPTVERRNQGPARPGRWRARPSAVP